MAKITSYLHFLSFDKKLKDSWIAKYILNPRLVLLVTAIIIGIGLYSFQKLPRTLNPDIKIPIVIVNVVLPGAGPQDVESLVTIPIEDAVTGITNVKTVTSSSTDSVSVTTIEFQSGVDPDKALSDIQTAVNGVTTLPKAAQTPKVIKLDFTNAPIWTFSIATNGDTGSLMRYATTLRDKIKSISSVKEVTLNGLEEQEIQVVIKPEVIGTYGLNPLQLSQAISTAIQAYPAGSVTTAKETYALTINQFANSIDDLRSIQVTLNGTEIPLSQLATIYERPKPDQNHSFIVSKGTTPKTVVTFNVFKNTSVNIDQAYADVKTLIDHEIPVQNGQFHIYTITSAAQQISTQFGDLTRDFIITILLVFTVLFIFLGIRQAIIASLAIPLTFLIGFTVMYMTNIALSFISMFSLLLALGLLVDDTIVVVSAMTAYYRSGKFTAAETGLLVFRDFLTPILTTTITTVWAFLPLLLSSGIIGDFIKPIPIVVSSTLIASIFVAMLITLPFVVFLLEPVIPHRVILFFKIIGSVIAIYILFILLPKGIFFPLELASLVLLLICVYSIRRYLIDHIRQLFRKTIGTYVTGKQIQTAFSNGIIHFTRISDVYHRLIEQILLSKQKRRLVIIMAVIFSLFSYILVPLGFVKNEFFPKSDQDFVFLSLELPAGTNGQTADMYAHKILLDLRTVPDIDFITADIGQVQGANGASQNSGSNNIQFTIVLPPKSQRHHSSIDIGQLLRDRYASYQDGKVSVVESTGGPPAGADLQIKLFGDDLKTLDQYANSIESFLKAKPGVVNIDKSIKPGTSKLVFVPDTQKIADAQVSEDQLGVWLRLFASGLTVNSVKFTSLGNVKEDITIRMNSKTQNPEALQSISIPVPAQGSGQNQTTQIQTLANLGDIKLQNNPTLITREAGKRTISVTASVIKGYSISDLNTQLEKYADSLHLPASYSWSTGGVNQQNQESVQSILAAMVLSFVLIIVTMVIQFGSFRRALIVMLVIPLSISGVFIIFALTNTPLSFPALIGMLALFGIVVKNSILVVDKIVQNEKAGMQLILAIADASSSRLEAIALTSVATIFGLIPVTLSDPIWQGLGGAIIAGLTFSGTIMLFFIPIVYYYWFHRDQAKTE